MDVNTITTLISSVGFPIVCCGALFWLVIKLETKHDEEMRTLRDALQNNTSALIELSERLRGGTDGQ